MRAGVLRLLQSGKVQQYGALLFGAAAIGGVDPRDLRLGAERAWNFDSWALTLAVFLPAGGRGRDAVHPEAARARAQGRLRSSPQSPRLGVGIYLLAAFDYDRSGELQFVVDKPWIDVIHSRYIVGIDGISLPLLILSMVIVVLCIIYSWNHFPEPHNPRRSSS